MKYSLQILLLIIFSVIIISKTDTNFSFETQKIENQTKVIAHTPQANVVNVYPQQNKIGAFINTKISIELSLPIDSFNLTTNDLFHVFGSNSGLATGSLSIDTSSHKFIFTPYESFFFGEVVNVQFGPIFKKFSNERFNFHWCFTVEITNHTNGNFDSLQRFYYPSFDAIALDYNNDGYVDIVSATGRIIYNDGNGSFNSYEEIGELMGIKYLIDINNDTILDIVTSHGDLVQTFLGKNDGTYSLKQTIYPMNQNGGRLIAKGDVNGDGFIDLISTEIQIQSYNNWRVLLNDSFGTFHHDTNTTYLQNWISDASLIDMDNDGDLDLVLLNTWPMNPSFEFEGMYIYFNNGLGCFIDSIKTRLFVCPYNYWLSDLRQLYITDYNIDGLNDIAAFGSVQGGLLVIQEPNNTFCGYINTTFSNPENFAFFTSGDLDGNNRFDFLVSNLQVCPECGDTAEVTMENFLNINPINFNNDSAVSTFNLGLRNQVGVAVVPILADVDNDGDLDVIHTGYPTTVTYNNNLVNSIKEQKHFNNSFKLFQNYPNPFNIKTNIEYFLPHSGYVRLTVLNTLGETIKILVDNYQNGGEHIIEFDASLSSSGLYLYKIDYDFHSSVIKMIYLK